MAAVCTCVEQRLCLGADNGGNWKIGNRLTDGDNRVATGVFNFAHTNIGIIIFLLSAPIMNKSTVQSCKPSYTGGCLGTVLPG